MKKHILIIALCASGIFCGCKKKGCTDPLSSTYDPDAKENDGTCEYYYGGKNYGQIDVGSEVDLNNEYDIYIDDEFIGRSLYYFPDGLGCGNPQAVGTITRSGAHRIKAVGNGGSDLREGIVDLDPQECKVVLIENLD